MHTTSLILILLSAESILAKWIFDMQKFEACEGHENSPQVFNNSKMQMIGGKLQIDFDVYVAKNLPNLIEASWAIEKCRSKENLDSCMPFYKFKTRKTCEMINSKGEMWSPFVECIVPSFQCPIKKGVYRARGCGFDISMLTLMPLTGGFWKCQILMSDIRKKNVISCLSVAGEIRQKY